MGVHGANGSNPKSRHCRDAARRMRQKCDANLSSISSPHLGIKHAGDAPCRKTGRGGFDSRFAVSIKLVLAECEVALHDPRQHTAVNADGTTSCPDRGGRVRIPPAPIFRKKPAMASPVDVPPGVRRPELYGTPDNRGSSSVAERVNVSSISLPPSKSSAGPPAASDKCRRGLHHNLKHPGNREILGRYPRWPQAIA
jgi:hypothetical protein